ncbi:MAG: N-6 DNA methylase [Candidatus Obscuribacterales bacterium]|nr:N-6 DNA methylase [Candidatus Obscuribacterales bacterium]
MQQCDSRANLAALRKLYFKLEGDCLEAIPASNTHRNDALVLILFVEAARRILACKSNHVGEKAGTEHERVYAAALTLHAQLAAAWPANIGEMKGSSSLIENIKNQKLLAKICRELQKKQELLSQFDERYAGYFYQYSRETARKSALSRIQSADKQSSVEDIISFTQLYTPDWTADYLLANAIVPQWQMKGIVNAAEKVTDAYSSVHFRWCHLSQSSKTSSASEIKIIDPACGAGHILLRAFHLFLQLHSSESHSIEEAVRTILKTNLHGCDLDTEALWVCAFSLVLKATSIARIEFDFTLNLADASSLQKNTKSGLEIGSLSREHAAPHLLAETYHAVVANPPYIGRRLMDRRLKQFLKDEYPSAQHDISAAFLLRALELCGKSGKVAFITQSSLIYLPSYGNLRKEFISRKIVDAVIELGPGVFPLAAGEKINSMLIVLNHDDANDKTKFLDLTESDDKYSSLLSACRSYDNEEINEAGCAENREASNAGFNSTSNCFIEREADDFLAFRGYSFNYKFPAILAEILSKSKELSKFAEVKQGLATSDNNRFIRYGWDVPAQEIGKRWQPYVKGAGSERWHAPCQTVLDWGENGKAIKDAVELSYPYLKGKVAWVVKNEQYYFRKGLTFSFVSTGNFAVRRMNAGSIFDVAGSALFCEDSLESLLLAYLNSSFSALCAQALNPTFNFQVGDIKLIPFLDFSASHKAKLIELSNEAYSLKFELNSFDETQIGFRPKRDLQQLLIEGDPQKSWQSLSESQESRLRRLENLELEIDNVIFDSLNHTYKFSTDDFLRVKKLLNEKQNNRKVAKAYFKDAKTFAEYMLRLFIDIESAKQDILSLNIEGAKKRLMRDTLKEWLEKEISMPLNDYFNAGFNQAQEKVFLGCPQTLSIFHPANKHIYFIQSQRIRSAATQISATADGLEQSGYKLVMEISDKLKGKADFTGKDFLNTVQSLVL